MSYQEEVMGSTEPDFKDFFEDSYLLQITDMLAKRYGKTPYEILTQMTLREFSFNLTVMLVALQKQREAQEEESKENKPKTGKEKAKLLSSKFSRTVIKKEEKK